MNKSYFLTCGCVLFFIMGMSCSDFNHGHGDTNISISESDDNYHMSAHFDENLTREVQNYMDKSIGDRNDFSFTNARLDADITLEDHTTFYIKADPGNVEINFDRAKNSMESFNRIKKMGQGIKAVIEHKDQ